MVPYFSRKKKRLKLSGKNNKTLRREENRTSMPHDTCKGEDIEQSLNSN